MRGALPYSLFKHRMVTQRADRRKGYFGAIVWCHFLAVWGGVSL
jgi:hypothetical protein